MQMHASVVSGAFALALAFAPTAAPAATFYLTTGLGTTETTIDAANPASWGFYASPTYSLFSGAVFAMKYDGDTSFGIQVELYDNSSMLIGSVTYANVVDYIAAGGSSEYEKFVFLLDAIGIPMPDGQYYTLTMSVVDDGGTGPQSYSVRGIQDAPELVATDDADTITVTTAAPAVTTPEPASALVVAAGLLGLGLARRHARPPVA